MGSGSFHNMDFLILQLLTQIKKLLPLKDFYCKTEVKLSKYVWQSWQSTCFIWCIFIHHLKFQNSHIIFVRFSLLLTPHTLWCFVPSLNKLVEWVIQWSINTDSHLRCSWINQHFEWLCSMDGSMTLSTKWLTTTYQRYYFITLFSIYIFKILCLKWELIAPVLWITHLSWNHVIS